MTDSPETPHPPDQPAADDPETVSAEQDGEDTASESEVDRQVVGETPGEPGPDDEQGPEQEPASAGDAPDDDLVAGREPTSAVATDASGPPGLLEPASADESHLDEELHPSKRRSIRNRVPKPVWHIGRLLILALIIEYLVVPQLAGPRKVIHLVNEVNPFLLLLGVGLEAASLLSYAQLSRTVLPNGHSIGIFTMLRVQMTTLSISHCAPGGTATGAAFGYRLLTQSGLGRGDVGFGLATQAIGSAVVLNVVLWVALIVSIPVWGFSAVYLLAAVVGLLLLLSSGALVAAFTRGGNRVGERIERAANHMPFVDAGALRRSFDQVSDRLKNLGGQRNTMFRALGWAAANWLFDAASLLVFVGAFGHWVNPDGLLVAYGLAYVLAALPITPGGLGVVEAALTSLLVGFGTPRGIAALGVVSYRLINFWLPIPLGGLAYLSLQSGQAYRRNHSGAGEVDGASPPKRHWWRPFQQRPPAI